MLWRGATMSKSDALVNSITLLIIINVQWILFNIILDTNTGDTNTEYRFLHLIQLYLSLNI